MKIDHCKLKISTVYKIPKSGKLSAGITAYLNSSSQNFQRIFFSKLFSKYNFVEIWDSQNILKRIILNIFAENKIKNFQWNLYFTILRNFMNNFCEFAPGLRKLFFAKIYSLFLNDRLSRDQNNFCRNILYCLNILNFYVNILFYSSITI